MPTQLTPEIIAEVPRLLTELLSVRVVAWSIGISPGALRRWLSRGKGEQWRIANGGEPREAEALFLELYTACKQALEKQEADSLKHIANAAKTSPAAARWLKEYKRKRRETQQERF
jgi:hypothetical protein